jgi:hypothetical protein
VAAAEAVAGWRCPPDHRCRCCRCTDCLPPGSRSAEAEVGVAEAAVVTVEGAG